MRAFGAVLLGIGCVGFMKERMNVWDWAISMGCLFTGAMILCD